MGGPDFHWFLALAVHRGFIKTFCQAFRRFVAYFYSGSSTFKKDKPSVQCGKSLHRHAIGFPQVFVGVLEVCIDVPQVSVGFTDRKHKKSQRKPREIVQKHKDILLHTYATTYRPGR